MNWSHTVGNVTATEILRGDDGTDLVVVLAGAPGAPTKGDMQGVFRARSRGGVAPLLLAVSYAADGSKVALLGLTEDAEPVLDVDRRIAEQLLHDALTATSPMALHAQIRQRLGALSSGVASGLRNEGLLASHVLDQQIHHSDWSTLCSRSTRLLSLRGTDLLDGLGYSVEAVPDGAVLRSATDSARRAAVVLLRDDETFDNPLSRFQQVSAIQHGLAVARRENVSWVVVLGGSVLRLYSVDPDIGVGRKGQTQTFIELDLAVLPEEECGYLALLFSPEALDHAGTIARLLSESARYATGLSERLRDRIYVNVVPALALAVANKRKVVDVEPEQRREALDEAYHQAMIILFRLLFVAYAEDRGLLPYETNERYRNNALKTQARYLLEDPQQVHDANSTTMWDDLTQVWKVIDTGDLGGWGIPPYNGGLFTRNPEKNPSGAATYDLDLTNDAVGPALAGLLIDVNRDGELGPVDFRSLSVREFGTIYEGLLESGLDIADQDLSVDRQDNYVPAALGGDVVVTAGSVYFHSNSGSRKASGSYFTKRFAVEHLVESALEPAIDAHLERVSRLIEAGATKSAAEALFDFRVSDLSMGSAHFLIIAVDRIEARFSAFLSENPLPEVAQELNELRRAAAGRLGYEDPASAGIDDGALLRRQIARRCIYGADINEIAVELARLSIWIQTFVPGLPLSFLNHGLIHANSLTGVGTLSEVVDALAEAEVRELRRTNPEQLTGLEEVLVAFLDRARDSLSAMGSLADASVDDVTLAGSLQAQLEGDLAPLAALCDLITAERLTRHLGNVTETVLVHDVRRGPVQRRVSRPQPDRVLLSASQALFTANDTDSLEAAVLAHPDLDRARGLARSVQASHMPVSFPEVFRRDRPGFDCVLGNPPWEKLHVEEHAWWALRFPGLRSLSQQEKNARIEALRAERADLQALYNAEVEATAAAANAISNGPYPGIGAAHLDLFSAFCWRFYSQVRAFGFIGVVLPRGALAGAATAEWRRTVLSESGFCDLTLLVNNRKWVFDVVHPQYTIALVTIQREAQRGVRLRGPFSSLETFSAAMGQPGIEFGASDVLAWNEEATFPLLPSEASADIFATLRQHPPLASGLADWEFRPVQGDLNATNAKSMFDFNLEDPEDDHDLPVWTGGTFDLWEPGSGDVYAYAIGQDVIDLLQQKRLGQIVNRASAYYGLPAEWAENPGTLPMLHPRIAFRDVARATDTRTMRCALVPGGLALVHKAPYLLRRAGEAKDEAYLLGVMSSRIFDWYTRRYVEITMSFQLLNDFPVPVLDTAGRRMDLHGGSLGEANYGQVRDRIVSIAGALAAVDNRYSDWAADVGVPVGTVQTATARQSLLEELDACVALLYGLTPSQVEELFNTFHAGWDATAHITAVQTHYESWLSALKALETSA